MSTEETENNATDQADEQLVSEERALVPMTAEAPAAQAAPDAPAKKPQPGEHGFTHGDEPKQVHKGDLTPEQVLAAKRKSVEGKMAHEDLALRLGMLPAVLEQPIVSVRRKALVPGTMNPKYEGYARAKAFKNWPPRFEVTEQELHAAIKESVCEFRGHNKRGKHRAKRQGQ